MENLPKAVDPDHYLDDGQYANFFRRLVAVVIDVLIVGTISRSVGMKMFSPEDLRLIAFAGVVWWLYFALMESSKLQGTVGKLFVKIKVTDMAGNRISFIRASARFFARFISLFVLGIGFLMIIWTDRKQGLHDLLVKTQVIKK